MFKTLIVDDYAVFRESLEDILYASLPAMAVSPLLTTPTIGRLERYWEIDPKSFDTPSVYGLYLAKDGDKVPINECYPFRSIVDRGFPHPARANSGAVAARCVVSRVRRPCQVDLRRYGDGY